jgi:type IV pilus assembly protein PilY1
MYRILQRLVMTAGILLAADLHAEDIDLFLGSPRTDNPDLPNVILFMDNTSNWQDAFETEKEALYQTFLGLKAKADLNGGKAAYNVGLVMYGQPKAGYVRAGLRPMTSANAQLYADMINSFTDGGSSADNTNARSLSRTIAEIHRYLSSAESVAPDDVAGPQNRYRDYRGSNEGLVEDRAIYAMGENFPPDTTTYPHPLDSASDTTYTSPGASGCAKTYVLYFGNTLRGRVVTDPTQVNRLAGQDLATAMGVNFNSLEEFPLQTYTDEQDNWADEWAKYLFDEMGVKFYVIDVNPQPHPLLDPDQPDLPTGSISGVHNSTLLKNITDVSEGRYFRVTVDTETVDTSEIQAAIDAALSEIQAVDSVFASVALPVSTTAQSVFLNQVFIGLFRPDEDSYPRWHGNLKQYQLKIDGSQIVLADAAGASAINGNTGFIKQCARSFWTPGTSDEYWHFDPSVDDGGLCDFDSVDSFGNSDNRESNFPDGSFVEKGGQAHITRSATPADRKVLTCNPDDCWGYHATAATLPEFDSSKTYIKDGLGLPITATDAEKTDIINWARGTDIDNDDVDLDGDVNDARPSIHGDVVHSRPVAVNYGTDIAPEIVVFYGANDGMLRAINGNQTSDIGNGVNAVTPGSEVWAFMPPEFYGELNRLYENTPTVRVPDSGTSQGATGSPKGYGIDGPLSAYKDPLSTSKFLYAGMRRSGRLLYAFDITDINTPTLKWKMGCDDSGVCTDQAGTYAGAWSELGQTWSGANVVSAEGYNSGNSPLLLMGGGYDDCEDYDNNVDENHSCDGTTKGAIIYVIDGDTGEIVKTFPTLRGVVGNITAVPVSQNDPLLKFAYATDMGGNIYRISGKDGNDDPAIIGTTAPADWIITRIASLGCQSPTTDAAGCDANRKFLFGPDVVELPGTSNIFAVLAGSGDREKPLTSYGGAASVENNFFSIIDQPLTPGWLADDSPAVCGSDIICFNMLTATSATITGESDNENQIATVTALTTIHPKGWRLVLDGDEQVVTSALTVDDIAAFSTHTPIAPAAGSCDNNLGRAITYNLNYNNADGEGNQLLGGGLAPSPVAGKVILDDGNGGTTIEPFCIGCGGERSAIGGSSVGAGASHIQPSSRVYWNIRK